MEGTVLDPSLNEEERLDALVAQASLVEMIPQLTNAAPALPRLGIPAYQWLNDDLHDVMTQALDIALDIALDNPVHQPP